MNDAIVLSHLQKKRGKFCLQDLSLRVPEGTICGLIGENGAGKTTTIQLLMGALRPDSGTIQVLGANPEDPAFRAAKEDIGVVLDEAFFPEGLCALQIGKVLAKTYCRWDDDCYRALLEEFQLPSRQAFKSFSRGMRMKLAIATALSHHPRLLVLDEPTAGLDPVVRDEVVERLRAFACDESHTILISSHILSDLEKLCDSLALLHRGQLLFCRGKDDLLDDYGIFSGTAQQADELQETAVVGRSDRQYGGVRALVRRQLVPSTLTLEKPTLEDVILFTIKGGNQP